MLVAIILIASAGLVVGAALMVSRRSQVSAQYVDHARAYYAAEAGLQMARREVLLGVDEDGDGGIGSISDDGNPLNDPVVNGAPIMVSATVDGATVSLSADVSRGGSRAVRSISVQTPTPTGGGTQLLMIVASPSVLPSDDSVRRSTIESWGYTVQLIGHNATQAELDVAAAAADVIYISETTYSSTLGTRLLDTTTGIVSEEVQLHDEFGFSSHVDYGYATDLNIVDNTHYITQTQPAATVTVQSNRYQNGFWKSIAPGASVLARELTYNDASLIAIEAGGGLYPSGTAAGRRVALPWCVTDGSDYGDLNATALEITRRAIEWASGN